jgi:hypothetical protein
MIDSETQITLPQLAKRLQANGKAFSASTIHKCSGHSRPSTCGQKMWLALAYELGCLRALCSRTQRRSRTK